jgi:hypothetical protein
MKQEEKDLLIKDLCGRLSHGVKCKILETNEVKILGSIQYDGENTLFDFWEDDQKIQYGYQLYLSEFKPCLFPFSSMTEEQWIDTPYANLNKFTFDSFKCGCSTLAFETYEVNLSYVVEFINWCYKNHFDIHGLIPMGLAIDATGLNIY